MYTHWLVNLSLARIHTFQIINGKFKINRERFYECSMGSEREIILIDLYLNINIICIYYCDYILYQYSNVGKPRINRLFDLPNTMYIVKYMTLHTRKLWIFTCFIFHAHWVKIILCWIIITIFNFIRLRFCNLNYLSL